MTDSHPHETREVKGDDTIKRSGEFSYLADAVTALGGTAGALAAAKHAKDITVAKIQANAQVKVARIENGRPEHGGGTHRAD